MAPSKRGLEDHKSIYIMSIQSSPFAPYPHSQAHSGTAKETGLDIFMYWISPIKILPDTHEPNPSDLLHGPDTHALHSCRFAIL